MKEIEAIKKLHVRCYFEICGVTLKVNEIKISAYKSFKEEDFEIFQNYIIFSDDLMLIGRKIVLTKVLVTI